MNAANKTPVPAARRTIKPLTLVLIGATLLIVGVTIFMATRGEKNVPVAAAEPNDNTPEQQVLTSITGLMNSASNLPPSAAAALGVYQQARDTLLAYVRKYPSDTRIRPLLAEVYIKLGENALAMATVEEVLKRKPDSAEALWLKGQLLQMANDANYLDYYRQAADSPSTTKKILSVYGLALIENRELDAAAQYLQKAVVAGANDAATLAGLGRIALAKKDLTAAETHFLRSVRDPRAGTRVWALLAGVQKDMGKLDDAAGSVQQALKAASKGGVGGTVDEADRADLHMLLGRIRMLQQRHGDAAEAFVAAAAFGPLRQDATLQAAKAFYLAGRLGQAMKNIDIADKFAPGDREVGEWKKRIEESRFGPAKNPPA